MAIYRVYFDFGAGAGWEDYTFLSDGSPRLYGRNPVTRSRAIHKNLKPVIPTCSFELVRDPALARTFMAVSAVENVKVRVTRDGAEYFRGTVRPTFDLAYNAMNLERFAVEAVGAWYRLEKKLNFTETWSGYKVCNPANKAASILHQLFYKAGFSDAELNLALIDVTIDQAVFAASAKKTYRKYVEAILSEFLYSALDDESGIVELYDLAPTTITAAKSFSMGRGGNVGGKPRVRRAEVTEEAVDVSYWPHKYLADQVVFEDTTGATGALACSIPVTAGGYYPEGAEAGISVTAEFAVDDYDLVAVTGASLEQAHTGALSVQDATQVGNGMTLRLYSDIGGVITKLQVKGYATVKGDKNIVTAENVANSDKRETIECDWVATLAAATKLARGKAKWLECAKHTYELSEVADLTVEPGEYRTFEDLEVIGVTQVVRVLSVADGNKPHSLKVTAEGAGVFEEKAINHNTEKATIPYTLGYVAALATDAQEAAAAAQATANSASVQWSAAAAPTIGSRPNAINGDTWYNTTDKCTYNAIGGVWVLSTTKKRLTPAAWWSFGSPVLDLPDITKALLWWPRGGGTSWAVAGCSVALNESEGYTRVTSSGSDPYITYLMGQSVLCGGDKYLYFSLRKIVATGYEWFVGIFANTDFSHLMNFVSIDSTIYAAIVALPLNTWGNFKIKIPQNYNDYSVLRFDVVNVSGDVYDLKNICIGDGSMADDLPDAPDNTSGIVYKNDNAWTGWTNRGYSDTLTTAGGVLRATSTAAGAVCYAGCSVSAASGKRIRMRIRSSIGSLQIETSAYYLAYMAACADWTTYEFVLTSDITYINLWVPSNAIGDYFEVAYYYIGDGSYSTMLKDISGNNHHATTVLGALTLAGGPRGKYLSIPNSGGYVALPADSFKFDNRSFSIAYYAKYDGANQFIILSKKYAEQIDQHLCVYISATGIVWFGFYGDDLGGSTAVSVGWHHVVHTFDVSTKIQCIYVDGALYASRTASGALKETNSGQITIGYYGMGNYYYIGAVDELQIYDHALSADTIAALYAAGGVPTSVYEGSETRSPGYLGIGKLSSLTTAAFARYTVDTNGLILPSGTVAPIPGDYMIHFQAMNDVVTLGIYSWSGFVWSLDNSVSRIDSTGVDLANLSVAGITIPGFTIFITAIIKSLFAEAITLLAKGYLKSHDYAEDTSGFPTTGFMLDVANQVMKSYGAKFKSLTVKSLFLADVTAGNNSFMSTNVSASVVATAYTKVGGIRVPVSGSVRVTYKANHGSSGIGYARLCIYRDGSLVWTSSTITTISQAATLYQTVTEDVAVTKGDYLMVEAYNSTSGAGVFFSFFGIGISEDAGILDYLPVVGWPYGSTLTPR